MGKSNLTDIIYELKSSKNLSDELIQIIIEDALKAAYKKRFGIDDNAHIILDFDNNEVTLFSKKTIVEEVEDDVLEIDFATAKELESECDIGDQLLLEFKPEDFSRTEIMVANQKAIQRVREFEGNSLYSEFKNKEGEIIIGYFLRENNNSIVVDLGRTEGLLLKKYQSAREAHNSGDRIKALIYEVKKQGNRFEVLLTRSHPEFIKKIFELEVPEIYDGTVEIVKIVREPGYRTKMAVRSLHADVDPIGTCVGTKGVRINNVMLELDNERIDILRYDTDPLTFIHNALSPADVKQVVITDFAKRSAIAVVDDDKLSVAIGKLGLNVKLANRLTDWSINIKTISQFQEMEGSGELEIFETLEVDGAEEVDIKKVEELLDLDKEVIDKLIAASIEYIEDLFKYSNEEFYEKGLTEAEVRQVREILQGFKSHDFKEDSDESEEKEESEESDEELNVNMLPLKEDVLLKITNFGIISLYELVNLFSEEKLSEIDDLSEEDIAHIIEVIKENVELE